MKIYLIGIKDNQRFVGNKGTFITDYKRTADISKTALIFADMWDHDEVYGITATQYTQKVCEMSGNDFVDYVRRNGRKYV